MCIMKLYTKKNSPTYYITNVCNIGFIKYQCVIHGLNKNGEFFDGCRTY